MDREQRQKQLEENGSDDDLFGDLDNAYYESEAGMYVYLFAYIRANAKDFWFSGEVQIP